MKQLSQTWALSPRDQSTQPAYQPTDGTAVATTITTAVDAASGGVSHIGSDDDDGDDDDYRGDCVDGGASQHGEQSSPHAPSVSGSQHGRNKSSNPSLTSPAPKLHDDSSAGTE